MAVLLKNDSWAAPAAIGDGHPKLSRQDLKHIENGEEFASSYNQEPRTGEFSYRYEEK